MKLITALVILASSLHATTVFAEGYNYKKLNVRCSERDGLRDKVAERVQHVVAQAAITLREVNPRVANRLEYVLMNQTLDVSCMTSRHHRRNDGEYAETKGTVFHGTSIDVFADRESLADENSELSNTILHEIFHFIKLDNFPIEIHNTTSPEYVPLDYVFTCAFSVFPIDTSNNVLEISAATANCAKFDGPASPY